MNREWTEQNKLMQLQLKKKDTFPEGIHILIQLRKDLMTQILRLKEEICEFSKQLQIDELYQYMIDVDKSTTKILKVLTCQESKEGINNLSERY